MRHATEAVADCEYDGEPIELLRETGQEPMHRSRICVLGQEQLQSRTEVMVGGDLIVVPQHLGSVAQETSCMRLITHKRSNHMLVEAVRQGQA